MTGVSIFCLPSIERTRELTCFSSREKGAEDIEVDPASATLQPRMRNTSVHSRAGKTKVFGRQYSMFELGDDADISVERNKNQASGGQQAESVDQSSERKIKVLPAGENEEESTKKKKREIQRTALGWTRLEPGEGGWQETERKDSED